MITGRLTVFVGDVNAYLRAAARAHDPAAFLVSNANWQQFCDTDYQDVSIYTSLGDLAVDQFCSLLDRADAIEYCPPPDHKWSDRKIALALDPYDSIQGITEYLILRHLQTKPIGNLDSMQDANELLPLVDHRRTDEPQLWAVGCSITAGYGVSPDQTWHYQLARDQQLECSVLAELGSSNPWQADQILRSPIKKHDVVVWASTGLHRQWIIKDGSMMHLNMHSHIEDPDLEQTWPLRALGSDTTAYAAMHCMKAVSNFCAGIGAKLMIFNANFSDAYITTLRHIPNFYYFQHPIHIDKRRQIQQHWIDLGTDHTHPGPLQHTAFAVFCSKILQDL
jgi:hypothetical protein